MNVAEIREYGFRSQSQRARTPRVIPCRTIARDLRLGGIDPKRGECSENVGFDIEEAGGFGLAVPMASCTAERRRSGTDTGGAQILIFRLVAAVGLAKFEQSHVGSPAIAVAGDGRQQAGQQTRPHRRHFRRDRVREIERGRAATEMRSPGPWE